MEIYLDTGNLSIICKYHKMRLICGVTTSPTILLRECVTGRMEGIREWAQKMAEMIVHPYKKEPVQMFLRDAEKGKEQFK